MTTADHRLSAETITLGYDGTTVVDGLSLAVPPGVRAASPVAPARTWICRGLAASAFGRVIRRTPSAKSALAPSALT